MRLLTFGALAITNDDDLARHPPIQRRQLALLTILAAAGLAGVTRDQLLALLWPEQGADRARHSLDQALYLTRRGNENGPLATV